MAPLHSIHPPDNGGGGGGNLEQFGKNKLVFYTCSSQVTLFFRFFEKSIFSTSGP